MCYILFSYLIRSVSLLQFQQSFCHPNLSVSFVLSSPTPITGWLSAKLNLPFVCHTFTQQTLDIHIYLHTHTRQYSSFTKRNELNLTLTPHTHTQIQFMMAKTTQCWVKAACTHTRAGHCSHSHTEIQKAWAEFQTKQKTHVNVHTPVKCTYGRGITEGWRHTWCQLWEGKKKLWYKIRNVIYKNWWLWYGM